MFGILTVRQERLPFLQRVLLRQFPSRGVRTEMHCFRMASFWAVEVILPEPITENRAENRVARALTKLRDAGVRRLVVPEQWRDAACALGFAPVEETPLLRACAARFVTAACEKLNLEVQRVCVTVCAGSVDRPLSDQLLTLARAVRTMRLRCPQELPILRNKLFCQCGVAVEGPLPSGAPEAALVLDGEPPESAAFAVDLTGEVHPPWPVRTCIPRLRPPEDAMRNCPSGTDAARFLSALYLSGGITAHEIDLDIIEATQYNSG